MVYYVPYFIVCFVPFYDHHVTLGSLTALVPSLLFLSADPFFPCSLMFCPEDGGICFLCTILHDIASRKVHSCQQKSIGLKFSKSQTGSDMRYSCHHNSSRFTFPIFAHSCRFSVLHSLQSITPRIY